MLQKILSDPGHSRGAGSAHAFHSALMFSAARAAYSVLVVDDDLAKRYALVRSLSAAAYRVAEAFSGAEALERFAPHSAVVLDVHLPDALGFDVCRAMKAVLPEIKIVHVSSVFVDDQFRQAGLEAGLTHIWPTRRRYRCSSCWTVYLGAARRVSSVGRDRRLRGGLLGFLAVKCLGSAD